jgi:isocitrate lyase
MAYAPYADLLWCETSLPDLEEARRFAEGLHAHYPCKLLACNCSPSFHWRKMLGPRQIASFQKQLAGMGYKYQFVTLAEFHSLNASMFELALDCSRTGMKAYAHLQEKEFALADTHGYSAIRHQRFVGTAYFDLVQTTIAGHHAVTEALAGSTEQSQFTTPHEKHPREKPTQGSHAAD